MRAMREKTKFDAGWKLTYRGRIMQAYLAEEGVAVAQC
jgi:hypothetical protein